MLWQDSITTWENGVDIQAYGMARWDVLKKFISCMCGWVAQNWLVCESCNPRKQNAEYHPETWGKMAIAECLRPKFYKPNYSSWWNSSSESVSCGFKSHLSPLGLLYVSIPSRKAVCRQSNGLKTPDTRRWQLELGTKPCGWNSHLSYLELCDFITYFIQDGLFPMLQWSELMQK